jgi:multidrug resistance efflux pump
MAYMRIPHMQDKEELKRADDAVRGQVSEENERAAIELLRATVATRRTELKEARAKARECKAAGQETLVRAEVADMVLQLLDSEDAALDDFCKQMGV